MIVSILLGGVALVAVYAFSLWIDTDRTPDT